MHIEPGDVLYIKDLKTNQNKLHMTAAMEVTAIDGEKIVFKDDSVLFRNTLNYLLCNVQTNGRGLFENYVIISPEIVKRKFLMVKLGYTLIISAFALTLMQFVRLEVLKVFVTWFTGFAIGYCNVHLSQFMKREIRSSCPREWVK